MATPPLFRDRKKTTNTTATYMQYMQSNDTIPTDGYSFLFLIMYYDRCLYVMVAQNTQPQCPEIAYWSLLMAYVCF